LVSAQAHNTLSQSGSPAPLTEHGTSRPPPPLLVMCQDQMVPMSNDQQQHVHVFPSPAQMVQRMTNSAQSALQVMGSVTGTVPQTGPVSLSQNTKKRRKTRSSGDSSVSSDENDTIEETPLKRVKFSDR
jgi:hypothetical protein